MYKRGYPLLLCVLLLFIKPGRFCKYFNNTCYKLFFSSDNISRNNSLENVADAVTVAFNGRINETEGCIEPGYEKVCSGHGQCINSTCQCNRLEPLENELESPFEYSGKFCEECPYCKGQRCEKFQPCLECILQNTTCINNCHFYYNLIENIEHYNYKEKMCEVEDSDGCRVKFKYIYNADNDVILDIVNYKRCLNGRRYIQFCCCAFLIYIIFLMIISKKLLNGVYYIPDT